MVRGNGSKAHGQEELLLDAADESEAAAGPAGQAAGGAAQADNAPPAAADDAPAERSIAAELVNTLDGCWMVTRHGKRVELSEEEWRKELAHALARFRPTA